jgi:hypothetical protein
MIQNAEHLVLSVAFLSVYAEVLAPAASSRFG